MMCEVERNFFVEVMNLTATVLCQVFLVWQLLLSSTILRKRYSIGQIGGCLLVIAGVVVVVASGSGDVVAGTLQQSGYFWPLVMIVSTFFFAAASILKEVVFQEGAKHLKGGNLDLFVVNSFGSVYQTVCVDDSSPGLHA
jgi:drug/metabolite transporter (DMT)-like permease